MNHIRKVFTYTQQNQVFDKCAEVVSLSGRKRLYDNMVPKVLTTDLHVIIIDCAKEKLK